MSKVEVGYSEKENKIANIVLENSVSEILLSPFPPKLHILRLLNPKSFSLGNHWDLSNLEKLKIFPLQAKFCLYNI